MAYSLVDGASSLLFSLIFRCNFMAENHHWRTLLKLKDPACIEASQASFHQWLHHNPEFGRLVAHGHGKIRNPNKEHKHAKREEDFVKIHPNCDLRTPLQLRLPDDPLLCQNSQERK